MSSTVMNETYSVEVEQGTTCLWYYNFYHSLTAGAGDQRTKNNEDDLDTSTDRINQDITANANNNDNGEQFWMDDEWTAEEMEDAKQTLQSAHDQYGNKATHKIRKLHYDASKNWNQFYRSHQTNFFNDRHYLPKAFPEEFPLYEPNGDDDDHNTTTTTTSTKKTVVEIGCGVGNALLPLLEQFPKWVVWGFDFSKVGIDLMVQDERFRHAQQEKRAFGQVWDMTSETDEPPHECHGVADICLVLFCLSAVPPEHQNMERAACHAAKLLKPGGMLVFRDYGRYDQAQFKLGTSRNKSLGNNFYVKHDGTMCYYFRLEDLERLFVSVAGLEIVELRYIRRVYKNRSKDEKRRRVWVQARFRKPFSS